MSRGGANVVRIVGGRWRSRRLRFADADGLRPTPDRVRETLFNWLQFEIGGAVCLDAFAGSGALGLEAISRGAARVVMLEKQRAPFIHLQEAVRDLGASEAQLVQGDTLALLRQRPEWVPAGGFDGVFLDPPFHRDVLPQVCAILHEQGFLKPEAFVYIESEQEWDVLALPAVFVPVKETRAGLVRARLARYRPEEASR
ncbi:MAG TPA: 16S rRNA (guanine(966)-N(2))-methyltransferase RsmD [Moraxellaceae bacterium]|nr:16S rRNA (guanine(966)-N(2))-methyltransferase RsmD [Moraxellaceae bacterium]